MTAKSMVAQRESSASSPLTVPPSAAHGKLPASTDDTTNKKNNNSAKHSGRRERAPEWPQPPVRVGLGQRLLEYLLFRFRWVFVIAFILPISLVCDCYHTARCWLVMKLRSAPTAHARKVAVIQRQIQEWNRAGRGQRMCTARAGHLTMCFRYPKYKDHMLGVKTDRLVDILEIDSANRRIRVEPMVTMGQLTRFLLPLGYTLPVVPELDDLTVGGIINGCGVESSGCKYGLFQHSCLSYEIVTANGELVVATKENDNQHQSLFYGIPWSHGTLGFLVAATIRIIPCKPYVRLSYSPSFSQSGLAQKLRLESARPDNDFLEAIQFNEREACVIVGHFADKVDATIGPLNEIGRWHKPWFFKHVEAIQKSRKNHVEYVPLRDYYHRHSRSLFWELQDIIPFGNHWLFRWLLGWAVPPKVSLLKQTMPRPIKNLYDRHHVLQDLLIPITHLEAGLDLIRDRTQICPLWLCPFNLPSQSGLVRNRTGRNRLYVDVGIYGNCSLPGYHPVETTRALEAFTRDAQGVQMLYADSYQKCEEFWEMFDASLYDWLRCKYDCKQAFPNVYEKTCRNARD